MTRYPFARRRLSLSVAGLLSVLAQPGVAQNGPVFPKAENIPALMEYADELQGVLPLADPMAKVTGFVSRRHYPDPGPARKIWIVYEKARELARLKDMVERIREENPGVEIVFLKDKDLMPKAVRNEGDSFELDQARALFSRILEAQVDAVLSSTPDLYWTFRGLRDLGYAQRLPLGMIGRRFVTVDIPRESLRPDKFSDPSRLPHRKYLVLAADPARAQVLDPGPAGFEGARASLEQALEMGRAIAEKEADDSEDSFFQGLFVRLSGQADSSEKRRLRDDARYLALYLEKNEIDVLATDDPQATVVIGEMKRLGYHVSLAVIWFGRGRPQDGSGLNMVLEKEDWIDQTYAAAASAPDGMPFEIASRPDLSVAIEEAKFLRKRLPETFGKEGGTTFPDYERVVQEAIRRSAPAVPSADPARRKYQFHFLVTDGNGGNKRGGLNPWGHAGAGVECENGKVGIWTVHYADRRGGSFTGGSDCREQLSLGEYLYRVHAVPREDLGGEPTTLGEAWGGRVIGFVFRDLDKTGLLAMRAMADYLDFSHLNGQNYYDFMNEASEKGLQKLSNCISIVTDLMRSAGYRVADSGTEAPGDKAVELFKAFGRRLLEGGISPEDFDLVIYEQPTHRGADYYRIANTVLGTPYVDFKKPPEEMNIISRAFTFVGGIFKSLGVPDYIESVADMAVRRVVTGPNSTKLEIVENPGSPIVQLRDSARKAAALRQAQVPLFEEHGLLSKEAMALLRSDMPLPREARKAGFWVTPCQDLACMLREKLDKDPELAPEKRKQYEGILDRFHNADVKLSIARFDELLEQRRQTFLKIRIADPLGKHNTTLDPIRLLYEEVLAYRETIEKENRRLTKQEEDRLAEINDEVEERLYKLRQTLIAKFGPPVPQDVRKIFGGHISGQTLKNFEPQLKPGDSDNYLKDKGKLKEGGKEE